jgi:hypothetical protein
MAKSEAVCQECAKREFRDVENKGYCYFRKEFVARKSEHSKDCSGYVSRKRK